MQRSRLFLVGTGRVLYRRRFPIFLTTRSTLALILSYRLCSTSSATPPSTAASSLSSVGTTTGLEPKSEQASDTYEPWEIKALVLALIPPANAGSKAMSTKEVFYLLPDAVQQQLSTYDGGFLAYAQQHFAEDILIERGCLFWRGNTSTFSSSSSPSFDLSSSPATTASAATTRIAPALSTNPPLPPISPESASEDSLLADATARKTWKLMEVLDALVEYIPTFFVNAETVAKTLPPELKQIYAGTATFSFFLRRYRHYFDLRTQHGVTDVRLRRDFTHPKYGVADAHYRPSAGRTFSSGFNVNEGDATTAKPPETVRRPPRNSEANLLMFVLPRIPQTYTPLAEVLVEVSDIVSRHPSFDARLGVTGFFAKYPEYFQIVSGAMRVRPYKSAPNSTDDLDASTSPLLEVFAKVKRLVDEAAEDQNYADEASKKAAMVPTGKLYVLLTANEKAEVKAKYRSFPRFLRLHGKVLVVSPDGMRAYQFKPEYERCAETILDQRLLLNSISPNDPLLKIPAEMDDASNADWAVRELYDALPLTQCAELGEVLTIVSSAVRAALPATETEVVSQVLNAYPDYFTYWPYPDDPSVTIVQRARLEIPAVERGDIARALAALVPAGGIDTGKLLRRMPLPMQRYLHKHGVKTTLREMSDLFLVSGDRVIRVDGV